jgi:hypothetical protein
VRGFCHLHRFQASIPADKRVVCYISNSGYRGLSAEELPRTRIVDSSLQRGVRVLFSDDGRTMFVLWDHFRDIAQLSKLIDFDPEAVQAFERAKKARPV